MNRKLRNTILAFSVTGTVLALGLLAARPVMPGDDPTPASAAVAPTDPAHIPAEVADAPHAAGSAAPAAHPEAAAISDIEARLLARSRQFEDDIVDAASLESAMALTAGFVATATTEAVIAEILSGDISAAGHADPDTASTPRRARSLRGAFAVPYFSFARGTGRGGRS